MSNYRTNLQKTVTDVFQRLKNGEGPFHPIALKQNGNVIGYLHVITKSVISDREAIRLITKWRKKNSKWFPTVFPVTLAGTARWAQKNLIDVRDRILFFVVDKKGRRIGHVGLFSFNYKNDSCEIDNIIRGEVGLPGVMTVAVNELIRWTRMHLHIRNIYLRVFLDNVRAIGLYGRCGFVPDKLIPLYKTGTASEYRWEETCANRNINPGKFFLRMKYSTTSLR
jgi:perosamine synthetase